MNAFTKTALAALPFALALGAAPAFAADAPVSVKVSHADLNLASAAGRATLDRRVNAAVRQACAVSGYDVRDFAAANKCRAQASTAARAATDAAIARSAT